MGLRILEAILEISPPERMILWYSKFYDEISGREASLILGTVIQSFNDWKHHLHLSTA